MPSHLTRHVFRRILANEPIVHRDCLRRHICNATTSSLPRDTSLATVHRVPYRPARQQRRTLFNFNMFGPQTRQVKDAVHDPGIEDMMHLVKMKRMKARLPPPEDIAGAFKKYIKSKQKGKKTDYIINDTHAQLLTESLRYCMDTDTEEGYDKDPTKFLLPPGVIRQAAELLRFTSDDSKTTNVHLDLARELFDVAHSYHGQLTNVQRQKVYMCYVTSLAAAGQAHKARDVVVEFEKEAVSSNTAPILQSSGEHEDTAKAESFDVTEVKARMWLKVMNGFVKEGNEAELLATLRMIRVLDWSTPERADALAAPPMLKFYMGKNDAKEVKTWFHVMCSLEEKEQPATLVEHFALILHWCLSNGELEFGQHVVWRAMDGNPHKKIWDAVFVWAAATGKGPDEINRMLDVMQKSNDEIPNPNRWRLPDTATINGLVEYATSKSDPYMAERYIALGKERGIEPDAKTYQLQIEYRLKVNDVDGALLAYKSLQAMDLSSNEDVPTVNQLIVALCRTKRHDFDTVMNVAMDLSDRRARFEPDTVATLALLHLSRDEFHDVVDLLNTHAHHFTSGERTSIRKQILDFCLDPQIPTTRSWDAYNVLRNAFDEMPREQRTDVLTNFFKRERPDMAVHVFTEMRRHTRMDALPTIDTYVASFLGSAKLRDSPSLEVIHNQLKLDYTIDMNTYLRNAMMIAYTACDRPRQALGFWEDIVASKEGPTYNSIHIALRACEKAPFGDVTAKGIWARLRKMKVDLDQSMWASYVAALAGNGDNELAITTIEEAESQNELEVDVFLLGSLMGGANNTAKQVEIEGWAAENHTGVWEELQKVGYEANDLGKKLYKIDRSVTP